MFKKILSTVLSLTMVFVLFSGISVSASNTTDGSVLVLKPGAIPILGSTVKFSKNQFYDEDTDRLTAKQTTAFSGIGFMGGVELDCASVVGIGTRLGVYDITLSPNTTVFPSNHMFVMSIKTSVNDAKFNNPSQYWCHESQRFINFAVIQNGKTYWSSFDGADYRYLDVEAKDWVFSTGYSFDKTDLNGIEGYVMFDISTVSNYQTWIQDGFNPNAECTVSYVLINNSQLGGEAGTLSFGGFYGVEVYSTSTVAQISGAPVNIALSNYDPNPLKGTTSVDFGNAVIGSTAWNLGLEGGNEAYGTSTVACNHVANCLGTQAGVKINSSNICGYATENKTYFYTNAQTSGVQDGVNATMLYLDLPLTGLGYNGIKITNIVYDGYSHYENANSVGTLKYLSLDGAGWIDVKATNNEITLPDGFKGYLMFTGKHFDCGIWYISFEIAAYGGAYGPAYVGGLWDLSVWNESVFMLDGTNVKKLCSENNNDKPIQASIIWANYDKNAQISGVSIADNPDNAVSISWSDNTEEIGTHLMYKISSQTAVGSAFSKPVKVSFTPWYTVNHKDNTAMIYLEIPKVADNATWEVKISDTTFHQTNANVIANNKNDYYWTNPKGMQFSYLAENSDHWQNACVATDGTMPLPSGFKGYVKIDCSTCENYRGVWDEENHSLYGGKAFDYNMDYRFSDFSLTFNYLGGQYGDFVVGGMYNIISDSESLYALVDNSSTGNGNPETLSSFNNKDANSFEQIKANIESMGKITLEDASTVETTVALFDTLSEDFKQQLSDGDLKLYNDMLEAFSVYRPSFLGVKALNPNGADIAGMRVGATVNTVAADDEGYSVTEYGTVMLEKKYFVPNNSKFDENTTGAVKFDTPNTDTTASRFVWDATYESDVWSDYEKDVFFRSYVVYKKNGAYVTVWNGDVTNIQHQTKEEFGSSTMESGRLPIYATQTVNPYYTVSLTEAANKFGLSILAGHSYGNLDGNYDLNNSSVIDSLDLVHMRKVLLGEENLRQWYVADVNGDGEISILDLVCFKKYFADSSSVELGAKRNSNLLNFDAANDIYGKKSVSIIGDSISQGIGAAKMYDNSWASLFKSAANKKWNSNNLGYVSFNDGYADAIDTSESAYKEIHKISFENGRWSKSQGYQCVTPGTWSYTANNTTEDSVLNIELNRIQGGVDRHINGFCVYYNQGAGYGSFTVSVNGKVVADVNADGISNPAARTDYIPLPQDCSDNIVIEIRKASSVKGKVEISGISYLDDPDAPTVNNYSLSGVRLCEISDEVLKAECKANLVILTLGTNDVNTDGEYSWGSNIELFRQKLDVIVRACRENGSTLVVGDVIWNVSKKAVAFEYKAALRAAALRTGGHYIDFTTIPTDRLLNVANDKLHPTENGYRLIAEKICKYFGI